ncbi:predicted protein [Micromonas commoda]|uniref:Uncharacterized protein n=1 Tax=Micromonas commoda (strain RCC299 / NOUM17 / CCMP2709) TaxID=296587 RepID=C1EFT4_MICCC|nr:predicted protein [Micromonas commoda]ACO66653.1 predicted protein [Micromonas commoda]|eukprot:XP_002505395.1 predicted protein [Micromonas commoda]
MSTTAGDAAPAPLTPTPSVRQRTIALESELLQHTRATVTGLDRGRASATSSPRTGPGGGGEAGPDTPPVRPAARGAEMNGDDVSSEAPVVVNVALSDPRAPHLPQASRASPGGGASRGTSGNHESAGSLGYSDRDAAAAAAMKPAYGGERTRPASSPAPPRMFPSAAASSAAGASPEPGWLRRLHLGESGARFSLPARWRPFLPWAPVFLRAAQAAFSLVAVACVASMNHPAGACDAAIADAETLPASTVAALSRLVDDALCLPSRNYRNFVSLEFLAVVSAALFVWSTVFLLGDLLALGAIGLGRIVGNVHVEPGRETVVTDANRRESVRAAAEDRARRFRVPQIALAGDASLATLTFSAACAVAGLRTGLDDLAAGYCGRVGKGWCDRMGAAAAFGFLSSLATFPSAALNTANKCGPW